MKRLLVGIVAFLFLVGTAWGDGVYKSGDRNGLKQIKYVFTADGSGDASARGDFSGTIVRVCFIEGTTTPSDNWDVTITDENSVDLLEGTGANMTATNCVVPLTDDADGTNYMPVSHMGPVTFTIADAGDGGNGVVVVYYR